MSASDPTLTESLARLRGRWPIVSDLLEGKYAVWLGSGISRERFPNLGQLLRQFLEHLHSKIQIGDANCPYRRCLNNVIGLTTIQPVRLDDPPANWTINGGGSTVGNVLEEVVHQLWEKYPEVLDQTVRVNDQTLTATFDLLKLPELYGDASKEPDAEHRFLSLLVAEGILDELVTTNWDALIESAHESCDGVDRTLKVIAASEDIDGTGIAGGARLAKIHGCARKTLADPTRYRRYILATRTDITAWVNKPELAPFRSMVHQIWRERPAFFIGLSGQDWNLQSECYATFQAVPLAPNDRPRVLFATPSLEPAQRSFLKAMYGPEHFEANEEQLVQSAAMTLRAKPLLGTLYLLTLLLKARALANRGSLDLEKPWLDFIEQARRNWQAFLQQRYDLLTDPDQPQEVWRVLADEVPRLVTRFVTMYRDLTVLTSQAAYRALDNRHLGQINAEDNVPELNYHWLMLVLALLREGCAQGLWELRLPLGHDARHGQCSLLIGGRLLAVFVARDGSSTLPQMIRDGIVDSRQAADAVVIYPADRQPLHHSAASHLHARGRRGLRASRLPSRAPRTGPLEIWLRDRVEDEHTTPAKLLQALKLEIQSS